MKNLRKRNLIEILKSLVLEHRVPILGICLGFQLLAESSTEFEYTEGLGFIQGEVIPLNNQKKDLAIPHVGWNDLFICDEKRIFSNLSADPLFYYCHSYHMRCKNKIDVIGITEYGEMITAAVASRNIFGVQFHPEKSQENGLQVLRNFINI
jgi:glutamine amidotransferase